MPRARILRTAQYTLTAAGVLLLAYCAAVLLYAKLYQAAEARNFAKELQLPSTAAHAVPGIAMTVARDGEPVGQLQIPRLGVSVMVVEGITSRDLARAAGHIPGTALPGAPGNVGIAGHRDTFFRPLRNLKPNDTLTFRTLYGTYRYRVTSLKVVPPGDVDVLNPNGHDSLTLVTCFPFGYIGPAPKRFIVLAEGILKHQS